MINKMIQRTFLIKVDRKAQLTMTNLLIAFVVGLMLFVLLPIINDFSQRAAGNLTASGAGPESIVLLGLISFFFIIAYIIALFKLSEG